MRIIIMFNVCDQSGDCAQMNDHESVTIAAFPALRLLERPTDLVAPAQSKPAANSETSQPIDVAANLAPPKGVTFVPTEIALLLNVTLPNMAASQRRSAVQFAIEDKIAQPLDQVHVVLGPKVQDIGTSSAWLVAVINAAVMESYVAAEPANAQLMLLDVLALQVPNEGEWTVLAIDGRVLVRLPDWSGFATTTEMLPIFWKAAGSPKIMRVGGVWPFELPVAAQVVLEKSFNPNLLKFDLRSGRFGRTGAGWPKGIRAIAIVSALAITGHLSLLALDVIGLRRIAATQETALRLALEAAGQQIVGDIDSTLTTALAAQNQRVSSEFLPILAQSFGAISPQSGQLQIRDLRFAEAQNALTLTIEAPDLAALQTAETAFAAAGLQVSAGAATTADGAAEAQMTLRRTAP